MNKNNRATTREITEDYARVGIHYYKKIGIPDKYGTIIPTLERWTKQTIIDDFPKVKKPFEHVPTYDAFCNVPDNTANYEQVINNCYNIYQRINHEPKEGKAPVTLAFLQHIYGGKYEVGLDYITILWRYPKQKLPIHCLVSKERKTGKTTFLEWLTDIFQTNATILSNESFASSFNSHYASKLVIGIDETFIDGEKRKEAERIKNMSTNPKIQLQYKGVDSRDIDFYGKLFMNSNNETDFVPIEAEETRYFVIKVPTITKEIPDIRETLREEIPAFLHLLNTRQITHPKETRSWFSDTVIETDALKAVIKDTKPTYQKVIDDFIEECFLTFNKDILEFSPKDIYDQVKDDYKYLSKLKIQQYLKKTRGMENERLKKYWRYNLGIFYTQDPNEKSLDLCKKYITGRPYIFYREKWTNEPKRKIEQLNKAEVEKQQNIHFNK